MQLPPDGVYRRTLDCCPRSLAEAAIIAVAAAILGFLSTEIMNKGMFRAQAANEPQPVTMISYEEAQEIYLHGGALFIDARSANAFITGHIRRAISLPLSGFKKDHPSLAQVPTDQMIITYCNGSNCSSSVTLARKLRDVGYTNVKVFFGGWNEWKKNNQPIEP